MSSETAKNARCGRANSRQLDMLVDYMLDHREFAAGRLVGMHGRSGAAEQWKRLMELLNPAGRPKSVVQWQKVWTSLKSKVRAKVARQRRERNRTGNRHLFDELTPIEEKVKELMGVSAATGFGDIENLPATDMELIQLMDGDLNTPPIFEMVEITTNSGASPCWLDAPCASSSNAFVAPSPPLMEVTNTNPSSVLNEAGVSGPTEPACSTGRRNTPRSRRMDSRDVFSDHMERQTAILKIQADALRKIAKRMPRRSDFKQLISTLNALLKQK